MPNNRKLNVFLPLLFAIVLALGMYLGHKMPAARNSDSAIFFRQNNRATLQEVLDLLKFNYVDTLDVNDIQQEAIEGMLSHLDPHSIYIPPAQVQAVNEDLQGNFEGIGVEFNITNDTVNVAGVIPGGPSADAGVITGDKIIKVNDSLIAGKKITSENIRKLLRGPNGSKVKTTMLRDGQLIDMVIKRGFIPLLSVDAAYMLEPGTGYIKLNKFSETSYDEFVAAVRKLTKEGMTSLVLDLRQNNGGLLDAATRIADELLEDRKLIVYTQGKAYPRQDYKTQKPGSFEKGPLAILVDEGSASASEILAGAVQDHDRGQIIGRRTFGKGLVQEPFELSNGGTLRLTIARYYLPSNRSIQKSYKDGRAAYDEDLTERYNHGEFLNGDSIRIADTVKYHTDNGRIVYGGGGITPDVFIPFDTSRYSAALTELYTRTTFSDFVYNYYITHRAQFAPYKTPEDFTKQFVITPELYREFLAYAGKDNIKVSTISAHDEPEIKTRLKAMFARQLWRTEGFYQVSNGADQVVKRAIDELKKSK
ncbi:S41 family peptidase [Chitinophaga horti]|uniref:S41 family peptidase n=1 Tax=Chitinophaga horti TaxID=2920382 RepID=A0ABY6IWC4_9BACT|nr:S41 family peptidase [Chitinophaga horti]UYQ91585.1 S41 family peptidase [Chitinophaga horti]